MTTRAIERVDEWETRSFGGGYRGLQELAERDFSGVVRSPAGTLCMLNGAVVGILEGSIEDFEDADGTAYEAPTPALALLIVMQDRADEVRAKYYTEDTPLSKVDSTLSDGGFTGFIELSENVLSGDYYVVYHAGRSMSVAFIGNSGQLLSEDEAFERADDEVGIYKVRPVEIETIEIPEPDEPATAAGASADTGSTAGTDSSATPTESETAPEEEADGTAEQATTTAETESQPGASTPGETDAGAAEASASDTDEPAPTGRTAQGGDTEPVDGDSAGQQTADRETASATGGRQGAATKERESADTSGTAGATAAQEETEPAEERPGDAADRKQAVAESTEKGQPASERTDQKQTAAETAEKEQAAAETAETERTASSAKTEGRSREQASSVSESTGRQESEPATSERQQAETPERERTGSADRRPATSEQSTVSGSPSRSETTATDLETRTIPSLDPERTWSETDDTATPEPTPADARPKSQPSDGPQPRNETSDTKSKPARETTTAETSQSTPRSETPTRETSAGKSTATSDTSGADSERVSELEETIAEREERIDELEAQLETARQEHEDLAAEREELENERDQLVAERDELLAERDDLKAELQEARAELADLREQRDSLQSQLADVDTDAAAAETQLSRTEAMDGTDLFVRYDSKGEPTLKTAHDSGASRSDVNANLNVEYHTQFETEGAVVAGQPFDTFLRNTIEFRFVSWFVRQLLFEIRDTGHQNALSDLYNALPKIDRAELNGEASVEYTEDGQTKRSREAFDVVLRDRMGNPMVVANFNNTREAATEDDMRSLVTSATRVGESNDTLAGAMYVTASFFEPEALETASESTGGGLLSRDKRESFVKVSRKRGYHLCLVEARDEQFHMAVPEL